MCTQHGHSLVSESLIRGLIVFTVSQRQGCPPWGGIWKKSEAKLRSEEHELHKRQRTTGQVGRSKGISMEARRTQLKQVIIGWVNYFALTDMKSLSATIDQWLRRRIRMCYWKQWKKIRTKQDNLIKLGIGKRKLGSLLIPEKAIGDLPVVLF